MRDMIRVLIVDDHDLVRVGIRRILESVPGIEVAAEASSGEEALRLNREQPADVVLMDVNMPGMGGLEATRRILATQSESRVIILTVHAQAPFPTQLLSAGASGYLTKGCRAEELARAIRQVSDGRRYVSTDIAQQLALSMLPGSDRNPLEELSHREIEVMMMLVQGDEIQQIADSLHISHKTVRTYKARLYEKLGVKNAVDLTHLAIRHGILETPRAEHEGASTGT